jgi:hypothetical protein
MLASKHLPHMVRHKMVACVSMLNHEFGNVCLHHFHTFLALKVIVEHVIRVRHCDRAHIVKLEFVG